MKDGSEAHGLRTLDFSGIRFPSDVLTISNLRKLHPDLFDAGFTTGDDSQPRYFLDPDNERYLEPGVGGMLFWERAIAAFAYAHAKGIDGPADCSLPEAEDALKEVYCRHQLATGASHAAELIRDIQRQAQKLARQNGR